MDLIKLNSKIYRYTQGYLDKALKKFDLSSGSFFYLLVLNEREGISQNEISRKMDSDKAMSARTITKLIKLNYMVRIADDIDSRAYKLYLSEKARAVIPKVHIEINNLVDLITKDLNEQEKSITSEALKKILTNLKDLKQVR